ncbi:MAG: PIN domain-containing protein [Coriobacteriia bacterium]|nr:PIN domain-containing protein [Coriobacteriia bacterium]MCL2536767.1 PIN domain-containing protein [Coriobacteriia bacterium]
MKKVLLDTNVILDAMTARTNNQAPARILELAGEEAFEACVTANSLTDILYVTQRHYSQARAQELLPYLLSLCTIVSVTDKDCYTAASWDWNDFEDALLCASAARENVDLIITSDQDFIAQNAPITAMTPQDFLSFS